MIIEYMKTRSKSSELFHMADQTWIELQAKKSEETDEPKDDIEKAEEQDGYEVDKYFGFKPTLRSDSLYRWSGLNQFPPVLIHKPTEFHASYSCIPDYERNCLRIRFYFVKSHSHHLYDSVDDFGDVGQAIGYQPGTSFSRTYTTETDISKTEVELRPEDQLPIFDYANVVGRMKKSPTRNKAEPILIVKYENKNICVARWDENRKCWRDDEIPKGWSRPQDIPFELSEEQRQMAQLQQLHIVEGTTPPVIEILPQPHIQGDDVPVQQRRKEIENAARREREDAIKQALQRKEQEKRAGEEAAARHQAQKEGHIQEKIGKQIWDKIQRLQQAAHGVSLSYIPTRMQETLMKWELILKVQDVNKGTTIEQIHQVIAHIQQINEQLTLDYIQQVSIKNQGIYARITIENGTVTNRDTHQAVTTFFVGRSQRAFLVNPNNDGTITFKPSGNWGSSITLPEGVYVIGRDGKYAYEVTLNQQGEVKDVFNKPVGNFLVEPIDQESSLDNNPINTSTAHHIDAEKKSPLTQKTKRNELRPAEPQRSRLETYYDMDIHTLLHKLQEATRKPRIRALLQATIITRGIEPMRQAEIGEDTIPTIIAQLDQEYQELSRQTDSEVLTRIDNTTQTVRLVQTILHISQTDNVQAYLGDNPSSLQEFQDLLFARIRDKHKLRLTQEEINPLIEKILEEMTS